MNILMVCLGNICRSPLAEGILRHYAESSNQKVFIDSAGTGAWHVGEAPDLRSIRVAQEHGIDISHQRARQISRDDLDIFDIIFAMDESNLSDIQKLSQQQGHHKKMHLLTIYAGLEVSSVPDPYYGGPKEFTEVFSLIDSACSKIAVMMHLNGDLSR